MAQKTHLYRVTVKWTGNRGKGTENYRAYDRDHAIIATSKPPIAGSSDPAFRGDPARWNPEELLVASVSACHKLWYLHLCAVAGICVLAYEDDAEGLMEEDETGGGRFVQIILRPRIGLRADGDVELATRVHRDAHEKCFIANSLNFPILCKPEFDGATLGATTR